MRRSAAVLTIMILAFLSGGCTLPLPGFDSALEQAALSDSVAADALAVALDQQGIRYEWAGQSPEEGFDCSGLVIWSYTQAYPDLTLRLGSEKVYDTTIDELRRYNVVPILPSEMKPGDIVFVTQSESKITHGGLFVQWVDDGVFEYVNASGSRQEVIVDEWPVDGTKDGHWFAGAGRLQTVI